jgi:feruloyl esterase
MMTHRFATTLLLIASIGLVGRGAGQSSESPATTCSAAALQASAPAGTTITSAEIVEAAPGRGESEIPRHCRVDGHVAVPGNTVNFRLGLPMNWNGKFYFQGVGGLGGTIGSLETGLTRAYASASTDTGHQASDTTWGANRAKEIDYGHRGTHVTAVAAKALTAAYYKRPPQHAYFNGCSNGGRQALMEVQRYPEDFDGIIAGHPYMGTPIQVGRAIVFQHMLASAENYLTAEKVELLSRATLAACDSTDGLEDGLITDPRLCQFRPETLQCKGEDGPECLTAGQIETVKKVYAGLKSPDGQSYTAGFPVGHEGGASGWRSWIVGNTPAVRQPDGTMAFASNPPTGYVNSEQNMRFLAVDDDDPGFSWRTLRFPADLPRLKVMTGILSPNDANLSPFRKRNGKLLVYHGWADPAISAYGTIDYFDLVTKAAGGLREVDSFVRLYMAPGMHHCSGGPGPNSFDMLPVLEAWVEKGTAPGPIQAAVITDRKIVRTRPLCPHPQVARYSGSGSIDDVASFRCEAPR